MFIDHFRKRILGTYIEVSLLNKDRAQQQEWDSFEDLDLIDISNCISFQFDHHTAIQIAPL